MAVTRHRLGPAQALLSAALFGLTTPLAKSLTDSLSPLLLAGLLYLGSGLGLALVLLLRRAWTRAPAGTHALLRREALPWLGGTVVAGGILGPVLLLLGLTNLPAAPVALLLNLEGVFTLLVAALLFREHVARPVAAGMLLVVAGGVALAWEPGATLALSPAALLVAGACLAWALDNAFTRQIAEADALAVAAVKGLAAGATNLLLGLSLAPPAAPPPGAGSVLAALGVGLVGYGASLVLFVLALRSLGIARTAGYFATAPLAGVLAAVLVLGERPGAQFALAAAAMAAGVWLQLRERHGHLHAHEPVSHAHRHVHDEHHRHAHAQGWDGAEPHDHPHQHDPLTHDHLHHPDIHHRHSHPTP